MSQLGPVALGPVALAAGGTGGHMFPAQAVARELLARGLEVVLVTDRRGGGFGGDLAQVDSLQVSSGGIAGGSPWSKAKSLLRLGYGTLQARRALKRRQVRVVVGFGGYASVPAVLAGASLGARVVLHEQNAVLGRANRLLARYTAQLATSFDPVEAVPATARGRIRVTGNPVRETIAALGSHPYDEPSDISDLRLLVTGGSQGALVFNSLVPQAIALLPEELRRRLKVTQQTPGEDGPAIAEAYAAQGVEASTAPFFEDLPARLGAAHLVICRAGASTIAELAAAGRPAILVPYPHATDDHQSANARSLAEAGGAWVMPQADLQAEALAGRLESLFSTPTLLTRAADCARAAARLDAAERLADLVCGTVRRDSKASEGDGAAERTGSGQDQPLSLSRGVPA